MKRADLQNGRYREQSKALAAGAERISPNRSGDARQDAAPSREGGGRAVLSAGLRTASLLDCAHTVYKAALSPWLHTFGVTGSCRFQPTCSEYAALAVAQHGTVRGGWLAVKRLVRCQPLSRGGWDPVPLPAGQMFHVEQLRLRQVQSQAQIVPRGTICPSEAENGSAQGRGRNGLFPGR
jgi:putative membrane protein insertion efficiency factor